jgi:hypothetical protein
MLAAAKRRLTERLQDTQAQLQALAAKLNTAQPAQ